MPFVWCTHPSYGGTPFVWWGHTLHVGTHEMRPQAAEVTFSPCTRGAPRCMEPLTVWRYCHIRCCNGTCSSVCCCVSSCPRACPVSAATCLRYQQERRDSHIFATLFKNRLCIENNVLHAADKSSLNECSIEN